MSPRATLTLIAPAGSRTETDLGVWTSRAGRDPAREAAYRWIKSLRHLEYGGASMRERFRYHEDSLWWFTEIYLHKMRRLETALVTVMALDAARESESPSRMVLATGDPVVRAAARAFSASRRVALELADDAAPASVEGRWKSYLIGLTATLSHMRRPRLPARGPTRVAAFVHTAFWSTGTAARGGREHYIGPVLDELSARLPAGALACVGVGPRRNFRARRWWDVLGSTAAGRPAITPVEHLAPRRALSGALELWRRRHRLAEEVIEGAAVRAAGEVNGCDLWPILQGELADAARLQWPWSARAMDEAGAALDALAPDVALTYAEAGGWGRALVLEARRRGIASVGIQHGFIYRHWLNYRHEADELEPAGSDRGCPVPDRTLLFDRYAATYLAREGHFRPDALRVTGSTTLDELAGRVRAFGPEVRAAVCHEFQIPETGQIVLLAAKFGEVKHQLPALVAAVAARPPVHLVIKPHPAETATIYHDTVSGCRRMQVAPAGTDLARLLSAADTLVTKNSTVAIDSLVLGIPAVVIGIPNNLSPFVDAGAMLGANGDEIGRMLDLVLYDQAARGALLRQAAAFAAAHEMRSDGLAATRAADEVLALDKAKIGHAP